MAYFKNKTQSWLKSATEQLSDSPAYKETAKETAQDAQCLQKLKKATLVLQYSQRNNKIIREAFQFALVDTKYAKAVRENFIFATIVHPALKECAYNHVLTNKAEKKIKTSIHDKDLLKIEKLFFGKNVHARTKCSSRPDIDYNQMVLIWKRLLLELNSNQHYKNMLGDGAKKPTKHQPRRSDNLTSLLLQLMREKS